ncbi:hypothetical protein J6590_004738 [Homalodisca vitripennis]|nr:hypothetical protein J6590_004738 [Homalodisca vitripennis]
MPKVSETMRVLMNEIQRDREHGKHGGGGEARGAHAGDLEEHGGRDEADSAKSRIHVMDYARKGGRGTTEEELYNGRGDEEFCGFSMAMKVAAKGYCSLLGFSNLLSMMRMVAKEFLFWLSHI